MKAVSLQRTSLQLRPDPARVLIRPFVPNSEQRCIKICARAMGLSEEDVRAQLDQVMAEFDERHLEIRRFLRRRFEQVRQYLLTDQKLSTERELLIGACFTHEYSLEAAALFNPSIVPHPDQSDLPPGALRFVLSLRATGEGHISSVTFRTGVVHSDHRLEVLAPTGFLTEPRQIPNPRYQ